MQGVRLATGMGGLLVVTTVLLASQLLAGLPLGLA